MSAKARKDFPVLLPTLARKNTSQEEQARAHELLSRVGLAERLNHRPHELSVGQQQRVAVARALINQPMLVLADEPTGSLDHENSRNLVQLLHELQSDLNLALVMVSHADELTQTMNRVVALKDGSLHPI